MLNPVDSRCEPIQGYYDDYSFTCKRCADHCLSCRTSSDCFKTDIGYEFNSKIKACQPSSESVSSVQFYLMVLGGLAVASIGVMIVILKIEAIAQARKQFIMKKMRFYPTLPKWLTIDYLYKMLLTFGFFI